MPRRSGSLKWQGFIQIFNFFLLSLSLFLKGGALQPSPIQDHSRFSSPTTSVTPQFSLLSSNQLKQMTPVSEGVSS